MTLVSAAHGLRESEDSGRIFVLDMGNPVRIVDLADRMIRMAGKIPGVDIHIEFVGIRPGEKLFEELFDRDEQVMPASFAGVNCAIPHPIAMPRLRAEMHRLELAARAGNAAEVHAGLAALVPGFGGRPSLDAGTRSASDLQPGAAPRHMMSLPSVPADLLREPAVA